MWCYMAKNPHHLFFQGQNEYVFRYTCRTMSQLLALVIPNPNYSSQTIIRSTFYFVQYFDFRPYTGKITAVLCLAQNNKC